ncbi:coiled-coil domain-containing protein 148 [Rhinatrema bivittatum]|uniref:coiled-coil domain-containing protein 148 n=1 Tax=Rhinatrema bivittatum TaxID=194408 RepID=UPI00112892FD|nr:coiled-coil domain-containing protein 148 [Rhinatrema bivittatum]
MSGRDLRTFITAHRTKDIDSLVVQVKNAIGKKKYKPVDYQQLHAITEAKKLASANIQLKIKKTEQASKSSKEQMLMKQHCQVWWQEHKRLNEKRQKLESEMQILLEEQSIGWQFFLDMKDFEQHLSEERETYKTGTVHPIWQLREDLKQRLFELQYHSQHHSQMEYEFNPTSIIEEVEFVKEQQKAIIERLNSEQLMMENELKECGANILVPTSEEITHLTQGIPLMLQKLECPYPDLKASILKEFNDLIQEYKSKLQEIDEKLISIDRNFGWTEEDKWIYQIITDQYSNDVQNRRTLYLDMLLRHLPHKSRFDVVAHETSWDQYRFAKEHRRALIQSWIRDRKNLLIKGIMTIAEACTAHETEIILASDRRKQHEICADLKEKVLQWRANQEETARLEAAIAARRREKEEENEKIYKEKEMLHRAEEKEKILTYYAKKQQKREEQEKKDVERLEELGKIMAEQAMKDRERVIFRQALLEKRLMEKKEKVLQEIHEEEERQKRLEVLRQQVAVVAEFDPVRMMGDTKASKARMGIGNEDFFLQKPLYKLNTYSEKQIISDCRVRVEMALREAGLHNTPYAKEILPTISPPTLPRRDMESTVFKM